MDLDTDIHLNPGVGPGYHKITPPGTWFIRANDSRKATAGRTSDGIHITDGHSLKASGVAGIWGEGVEGVRRWFGPGNLIAPPPYVYGVGKTPSPFLWVGNIFDVGAEMETKFRVCPF